MCWLTYVLVNALADVIISAVSVDDVLADVTVNNMSTVLVTVMSAPLEEFDC